MSSRTTIQGQAWDQLAKDVYGKETRLDRLLPENVDEMDTLLFGGDVRGGTADARHGATPSVLPPGERL